MPPRFAGYLLPDQRVAIPTHHPQVWLIVTPGDGHARIRTGELAEGSTPLVPVGDPEASAYVPPDVADGLRHMRRTLDSMLSAHRCPEPDRALRDAAELLLIRLAETDGDGAAVRLATHPLVTDAADRVRAALPQLRPGRHAEPPLAGVAVAAP
jgi:hypothetical protein